MWILFKWKLSVEQSKENLEKVVNYYKYVKSFIQNAERKIIQSQKLKYDTELNI